MHRIDGPGHDNNHFTAGDPELGEDPTQLTADWCEAIQEEILAVVEHDGTTPNKADNTQLLAAIRTIAGRSWPRLHNPFFEWWQRKGTSPSAITATAFLSDRWEADVGVGGSPSVTCSRQEFALGTIPTGLEPLGQPWTYMRWDQTVAATTSSPRLQQRIENVRTFAGLQVTVSYFARVTSGSIDADVRVIQDFGTGGSPSSDVTKTAGTSHTIDTTWRRYTTTLTLDALTGKTIGTDDDKYPAGGSHLKVELQLPRSVTFTLEITGFRIDPGPVALNTWPESAEDFLALSRYFECSWEQDPTSGDPSNENANPIKGVIYWNDTTPQVAKAWNVPKYFRRDTGGQYDETVVVIGVDSSYDATDEIQIGGTARTVTDVKATSRGIASIHVVGSTPSNAFEEYTVEGWYVDTEIPD